MLLVASVQSFPRSKFQFYLRENKAIICEQITLEFFSQKVDQNLTNDNSSPRKVRNKSKNRYNTLHRLTSIVEEKDILAAKELMNSKEDEVFD